MTTLNSRAAKGETTLNKLYIDKLNRVQGKKRLDAEERFRLQLFYMDYRAGRYIPLDYYRIFRTLERKGLTVGDVTTVAALQWLRLQARGIGNSGETVRGQKTSAKPARTLKKVFPVARAKSSPSSWKQKAEARRNFALALLAHLIVYGAGALVLIGLNTVIKVAISV